VKKFLICLFQKFSDPLSENLVHNRASRSVNAADNPLVSAKLIMEDYAIPLNPDPIKPLQISFKGSDITLLQFEIF
jgi:hypothetical protein